MTTAEGEPILRAAGDGDLETLRYLLQKERETANLVGANPYWGGRVQPLHMAVTWGQEEAVAILLEAGADPSGENDGYGGWSPLLLAATKSFEGIAARLEAEGAFVGLYEAAALGRIRTVSEILAGNPERARHVTPDGTTPLHVAASVEVADALIATGAPPGAVDGYGCTPLDSALARAARGENEGAGVAHRLIAAGAEADACTYAALGDLEGLEAALAPGEEAVDHHRRSGATPLCAAVAHGRMDAVAVLLHRGANPGAPDAEGIQPLHWVARAPRHRLEIARLLLAAGADPRGRDGQHRATPASWAEFQRQPELERLLRTAEESTASGTEA